MPLLEDLREAFTRSRKAKETAHPPVDEALNRLNPATVRTLARCAGQTLPELDATFELLPLGTRLALSRVGALELLDRDGADRFGLRVLPFAATLVAAAAERTAELAGDDEDDDKEVNAYGRDRQREDAIFEAQEISPEEGRALLQEDPEAYGTQVVGVVRTAARVEDVNAEGGIGWLRLTVAGERVAYPLTLAPVPLTPGESTSVQFAVRVAESSGNRFKDLPDHIITQVAEVPGRLFVHYDVVASSGKTCLSFLREAEAANGVAVITEVGGSRPTLSPWCRSRLASSTAPST
jgi:hypothetical protein